MFSQTGYYLFTGSHLRPYWFIIMLVFFYLSAPVLVRLDRLKGFYGCLPALLLFSYFNTRDFNVFTNFLHFIPVFIFGMFISRFRVPVFERLGRFRYMLFGMTVLSFCATYVCMEPSVFFVQKLLFSVTLLYLLKVNQDKINGFWDRVLSLLAVYSFGIYFVHDYFDLGYKFVLEKVHGYAFLDSGFVVWLGLFSANLLFCLLILGVAKRLLGRFSRPIVAC